MSKSEKPLTEGDAFKYWICGLVTVAVILLMFQWKVYARLDALDEACGVEQVEEG